MAKAEIANWPLVGWLAASGGTIFHRRGSNHSLAAVMQVMVDRLREGRSVAVFPEGGTGHNGVLKVFHARIFQAALDADVPVQPVALRFARDGKRLIDAGFREDENFMQNILRMLGGPSMDAEVHFLEPVPTSPDGRRRMADFGARANRHRVRGSRRMTLPSGRDFRPPWPLTSGHIQTMLSSSGVRSHVVAAPCVQRAGRCGIGDGRRR